MNPKQVFGTNDSTSLDTFPQVYQQGLGTATKETHSPKWFQQDRR